MHPEVDVWLHCAEAPPIAIKAAVLIVNGRILILFLRYIFVLKAKHVPRPILLTLKP
jgi:hypothetical protein